MEEGVIQSQFAPLPLTFYRADGSLIKKIKSSFFKGREKIQWFDENNNIVRESSFIAEDSTNKSEVTGIAYTEHAQILPRCSVQKPYSSVLQNPMERLTLAL